MLFFCIPRCYNCKFLHFKLLPTRKISAKFYVKGQDKLQVMIFLSRVLDQFLLFFGYFIIM